MLLLYTGIQYFIRIEYFLDLNLTCMFLFSCIVYLIAAVQLLKYRGGCEIAE